MHACMYDVCICIYCSRGGGRDLFFLKKKAYAATAQARVRRLQMQDVPSLEAASLDFVFIRQLRVDSSVDQQESTNTDALLLHEYKSTNTDSAAEGRLFGRSAGQHLYFCTIASVFVLLYTSVRICTFVLDFGSCAWTLRSISRLTWSTKVQILTLQYKSTNSDALLLRWCKTTDSDPVDESRLKSSQFLGLCGALCAGEATLAFSMTLTKLLSSLTPTEGCGSIWQVPVPLS